MATARREIRAAMPEVDLVIEVLDARIPWSSENPLVPALRGEKPHLRVLNKADLADPEVTAAWLEVYGAMPRSRAFAHHHQAPGLAKGLVQAARSLVSANRTSARPLMAMILGIPNVGKSTLINALSGRNITKTSDKPGVTRMQQRVNAGGLTLLDTPGFLWPKLDPPVCGYRLALTGAIASNIYDAEEVAEFAAAFLTARHPEAVLRFYGLQAMPTGAGALVEAVGRKRGALQKGGTVDRQKAAERLLHDFRSGAFGRITLETPAECRRAAPIAPAGVPLSEEPEPTDR